MAGWGDDPVLEELRGLIGAGWVPVAVTESAAADTVKVARDGAEQELRSDHIAFHRYVEGILEDFPAIAHRRA